MPRSIGAAPRRRSASLSLASAAALCASLLGAADGRADLVPGVSITATQVVVTTTKARVTVTRNPFRMTFQDANGATVLSQAPSAGAVNAAVSQSNIPPGPSAYVPFAFVVGSGSFTTEVSGTYQGHLKTLSVSGTEYAATSVDSATQQGGGASLVVNTSLSGHSLLVALQPGSDAASIEVTVDASPSTGVIRMADSFVSTSSEAFRGFGGRHNALNQRGQNFFNWIEQENVQVNTTSTELKPSKNKGLAAYHLNPMFLSSNNYGFLLDQADLSAYRLATDSSTRWQTMAASSRLRYVVAPGDAAAAIQSLTRITGRHPVPPDWALGAMDSQVPNILLTFDKNHYKSLLNTALTKIDQQQLPLTAFTLHCWGFLTDTELAYYVQQFNQRGIRVLGYFKAPLQESTWGYDIPGDANYAAANGYLVKTTSGADTLFVDFTNPAAYAWWKQRIKAAFDKGIDGFMQDFGEGVSHDWVFYDGSKPIEMHNRYPVLYHRATREAIDEYQAQHPDREFWFYTRAGFTGSQAYEGAIFPGDEDATWARSNGIASLATTMLNMGVTGAYGFATNIGGYFDVWPRTPKELYTRWVQWAALSPVFMNHNSWSHGTEHCWTYDSTTNAICKSMAELHNRASGYIKTLWQDAQTTGIPVARPLWLAFPGDATAAAQDQQWMLGPDVLVAPVVVKGATTRAVYFPSGCWRNPVTGQSYNGPATLTVSAPISTLPYYFRCGTAPF